MQHPPIITRFYIAFLITFLITINTNIFAIRLDSASALESMPQYTATFKLKETSAAGVMTTLLIRSYQKFGDGGPNGWQTPVSIPSITFNGTLIPYYSGMDFAYTCGDICYMYGSVGLGYDQFAQYHWVYLDPLTGNDELVIKGSYDQVAYFSATVYIHLPDGTTAQEELIDSEIDPDGFILNPYKLGNQSVFAYNPTPDKNLKSTLSVLPVNPDTQIYNKRAFVNFQYKFVDPITGKIGLYRPDRITSQRVFADEVAADGCSMAYLFGQKESNQEIAILRIKVPTTFIDSNNPDTIFGNYQARYFSVSANRKYAESSLYLDYWSVNARMLKKYADSESYAYVFFAPNEFTHALALKQHTPKTQPPVMTWGKYTGYILGEPDFAIILRYRVPNPKWQGSPENAICYATSQDLAPVSKSELGDYTPEIYGDTLKHFRQGNLGIVNNKSSWPVSQQPRATEDKRDGTDKVNQ